MIIRIRLGWLLAAALACTASIADRAHAAEHLMKVNEVMLSTGGDGTAQFIELFDPSAEPFPGSTYALEVYDAGGTLLGSVAVDLGPPAGPVRILISTATGPSGDYVLPFGLPSDGQACFVRSPGSQIHCVAWGCVTAPVTLATETAPSPPDGMSIQRQGAGAWHIATPTPDAVNTAGTMEAACPGGTDAGPGGSDAGPGGSDAGPGGSDAGPGGSDAGPGGSDAGPGGSDAGLVGSDDAGPAGSDAGTGGGDGGCSVGRAERSPLGLLVLLGAIVAWHRRRRHRTR